MRMACCPGNIVGAIANEASIEGKRIGHIDIREDHSYVDLPTLPDEMLGQLQKTRIRGEEIRITRVDCKPDKPKFSGQSRRPDRMAEAAGEEPSERRPYTGGGNRFEREGGKRPYTSARTARVRRARRARAADPPTRARRGTRRDDNARLPAEFRDAPPESTGAERPERPFGDKPFKSGGFKPALQEGRLQAAAASRKKDSRRIGFKLAFKNGRLQEEVHRQGRGREGQLQGRQGLPREVALRLNAPFRGAALTSKAAASIPARVPLPSSVCGSRCSSKYWRMSLNRSP